MKRQFLFLVICTICSYVTAAQTRTNQTPTIASFKDISGVVTHFYNPNADSLKNNCWLGCVFIRFQYDNKHRRFINVEFTEGTPRFIADALNSSFEQINARSSEIIKLKNPIQKTFLLPIIIGHNQGCGLGSGWESEPSQRNEKEERLFKERQRRFDHTIPSVFNIVNFKNNRLSFLECVLLEPGSVTSPMY